MRVNLAELRKKGFIHPIAVDKAQIVDLLQISERDIGLAGDILSKSFDGSLNLSYNAMLQAARALMFSHGYRPDTEAHHKATIEFAAAVLDQKYRNIAESLERVKGRRVVATYERSGAISEFEAKYALASAKEFVKLAKEKIRERLK